MKNLFVITQCLFFCFITIGSIELPVKGLCAHRGDSANYPENTKVAIVAAINLGVQMVEFDVRTTRDNKLVLMHDATLNRTTNGIGLIKNYTLAEVKKLDAGAWKSNMFIGEKVPTLEEILEIVPDTVWMNIHIKEDRSTALAVAELLTKRRQIKNAVLAVDNNSALAVREYNSDIYICCIERGNSSKVYFENTLKIKADFIQLTEREFPFIDQAVEYLKKHNLIINFYFADTPDKLKKLFNAGVDFVLVNNLSGIIEDHKTYNLGAYW